MEYEIYSVKNYEIMEKNFGKFLEKSNELDEIKNLLKEDNFYHLRLKEGETYILYIDLDNYIFEIQKFFSDFKIFMKDQYNLIINDTDFSYTQNSGKKTSYHISIPKYSCSTKKQKEIFENFFKSCDDETKKAKDLSVYCNKWFRLPNQTKGTIKSKPDAILSPHKIIVGKMKDFILNYIPRKCENIENVNIILNKLDKIREEENSIIKELPVKKNEDFEMIEKILNILEPKYYDDFYYWQRIGFILKKYEKNTKIKMLDLFDRFSKKSKKYDSNSVLELFNKLENYDIKINLPSLFFYAKESNLNEYKEIIKLYHKKIHIDITEKFLCLKIKELAGEFFFYKDRNLFSFDKKINFWYQNESGILKKYINDELYDFVSNFINDAIDDRVYFSNQINKLRKLCLENCGQEKILATFENRFFNESLPDDIQFNDKKNLFGFSNGVYDLSKNEFRNYRYDDYMTLHAGYDYKKGSVEDIEELNKVLIKIMPDNEKRYLLLQILASGLINKAYPYFFIFNGKGGNGKSSITKLMKVALGNFYYKLDSKYLTEVSKQGANPELANLNYKRYVVSSEPPEKNKIQNAIYKKLTGDGELEARTLFSKDTIVKIAATFILECNARLKLAEEPTDADARRIIDLLFSSKFTNDENEIDETKFIFKADKRYEDEEQLKTLKHAFFEILANQAHIFLTKEDENFSIPQSVKNRSQEYLNLSCQYLEFLNEVTTKDENEFITIHDLYDQIKTSDLYINSTKEIKRGINLKSLIVYFESNNETKKKYKEIYNYTDNENIYQKKRNVLLGYKFI